MKRSHFITSIGFISFFVIGINGCVSSNSKTTSKKGVEPVYYAVAVLQPTAGNTTQGQVFFSEAFGKVKVEVQVSNLDKNSQHGIHIHEFGDCTAIDAASAGGHYNPEGHQHASVSETARHAGDLGNLVTDGKGNARLSLEVNNISINGVLNPIVGRAVIVHKNADDLVSQPAGGAGPRLACGVIGAATR